MRARTLTRARGAVTFGVAAALLLGCLPMQALAVATDGLTTSAEGAVEQETTGVIEQIPRLDTVVATEGDIILPSSATALMSDGTTTEVAVLSWVVESDPIGTDPLQLTAGTYELIGTVEGSALEARLTLEVLPALTEPESGVAVASAVSARSGETATVTTTDGVVLTYETVWDVPAGFDAAAVLDSSFHFTDENGSWRGYGGTWDVSKVNVNVAGSYTATFTAQNEGIGTIEITVRVLEAAVPTQYTESVVVGDSYNPLEYTYLPVTLSGDGASYQQSFHVTLDETEYAAYLEAFNNGQPGTYTIHGTFDNSSHEVVVTAWIQSIRSIESVTVVTAPGIAPTLPNDVGVFGEDGTYRSRAVTWDAFDSTAYETRGYFEVLGTVEGSDIRAVAEVHVSPIASVSETEVVTAVGTPVSLSRESVRVNYLDTWHSEYVYPEWEVPAEDDARYNEVGSFDVYGAVEGTDEQAVCHVYVIDDTCYENELTAKSSVGRVSLPWSVTVTLPNGGTYSASVSWDYNYEDFQQEGTFDVKGRVQGSDALPITAHVTVVGIASVEQLEPVTTIEQVQPSLPNIVDVTYTDGTTGTEYVSWDTLTPSQILADSSPLTATGALDGSGIPIEVQVNVLWVQPTREIVQISTFAGWSPELPYSVNMTMSDGTQRSVRVLWETPDPAQYATAGTTFEVQGYITGSDYPVTAEVSVCDIVGGTEIEVSTGPGVDPTESLDTYLYLELDNGESLYVDDRILWETVDPENYAEVGNTFDARGSIAGASVDLVAHVTVRDFAANAGEYASQELMYLINAANQYGFSLPTTVYLLLSDGSDVGAPVSWGEVDLAFRTTPGKYVIEGDAAGLTVTYTIDSVRALSFVGPTIETIVGAEPNLSQGSYGTVTVEDGTGTSTREMWAYDFDWNLTAEDYATAGEKSITGTAEVSAANGYVEIPASRTLKVYSGIESYSPVNVWVTPGTEPVLPDNVTVTYAGSASSANETSSLLPVTWESVDPSLYATDRDNTSFEVKGTITGTTVEVVATVEVASVTSLDVPAVTTAPGAYPSMPRYVYTTRSDGKTSLVTLYWESIPASSYRDAGSVFDVKGFAYFNGIVVADVKAQVSVVAVASLVPEESLNGLLDLSTVEGSRPLLPSSVPVELEDGSIAAANVTWEAVDPSQYAVAGAEFEVTGTVSGFAGSAATLSRSAVPGTVVAHVSVVDTTGSDTISYVQPKYYSVVQGGSLHLEASADDYDVEYSFVRAYTAGGGYHWMLPNWDDSTVDYDTPGTYVMYGSIGGDDKAVAYVTVTPAQVHREIISVEPFERTFKLGVTREEISLALPESIGVTYDDSSTGVAAVTWNLTGLTSATLSAVGNIEIAGTVEGTDIVATATIHLIDDDTVYATGAVTPEAVETVETYAPELPSEVSIEMSDGTTLASKVAWEDVPSTRYAIGTANDSFTVLGVTEVGGFTVEVTVNVTPVVLVNAIVVTGEGVEGGAATLEVGGSLQLSAEAAPAEAHDTTILWASSDESVVTVSDGGLVTAVGAGAAEVTAASRDGGASATVTVTVPAPEPLATFLDVPEGVWYTSYVQSAVGYGIMNGEKANGQLTGYFRPENQITRAEVATVLFRIANPGSTDTSDPSDYAQSSRFPDVQGGRYYTAAVEWCAERGVVTGYKDGTGEFRPDNCVTRQELATMVWRFCRHMGVDVSDVDPSAFDSMLGTGEVAHWSLDAMRWCASEGIVTGVRDGDVLYCQPEGTATRAMAAKIFSMTYELVPKA